MGTANEVQQARRSGRAESTPPQADSDSQRTFMHQGPNFVGDLVDRFVFRALQARALIDEVKADEVRSRNSKRERA